jgi:hypothetical protein
MDEETRNRLAILREFPGQCTDVNIFHKIALNFPGVFVGPTLWGAILPQPRASCLFPPSHLRHSFLGIADLTMALEKRQDQNMLAWDEVFGDGKWECNAIPRPWRNYSCELVNFPITCSFAKYLKGSNPQSTPWSTCDGNCMYMEQEGFYAFIGIATSYPRIASLQNSQRAL